MTDVLRWNIMNRP